MNPADEARWVGTIDSWLAQTMTFVGVSAPANGAVLADTGQLAGGQYDVFVSFATSVALGWDNLYIQWRNAANNGITWTAMLMTPGADFKSFVLRNIKVATNERFRFYVGSTFTGLVYVNIIAERRT